jgi:hypothetical protein
VASSVVWEPEPVTMTADQALQATDAQAGGQAPAGAEAEDLLLDLLGSNAVPVTDVKAEAKAAGIAWASVRRAKDRLGVIAERDGFGSEGKWLWRLPAPSTIGAHFPIGAHSRNASTYGENEHLRSDDSPKVLTSTKGAHPFNVSTYGENEHLWGREGDAHQPSQPNGKGGADLLRDMNGAGIKRRNDMEDYPLAPDGTPDDPAPEWQRGSPEPKHPAVKGEIRGDSGQQASNPSVSDKQSTTNGSTPDWLPPPAPRRPALGPCDDGLEIPTLLQRCQHCGKPGAEWRDLNGRAVHLHERCEHAWTDQQ